MIRVWRFVVVLMMEIRRRHSLNRVWRIVMNERRDSRRIRSASSDGELIEIGCVKCQKFPASLRRAELSDVEIVVMHLTIRQQIAVVVQILSSAYSENSVVFRIVRNGEMTAGNVGQRTEL